MAAVNFVRVGRVIRTLRRNRGWRQVDLASRAVCSQQLISTIESGRGGTVSLRTLDRVAQSLGAEIEVAIRWHGGQLERLLDEGHAVLAAEASDRLERLGWSVRLEVSYETPRSAGSVDMLGFEGTTGSLVVIEVKTELLAAEQTLRKHDEKVRLAAAIAADRFDWRVQTVSRLLVVPTGTTSWRALARPGDVFGRAYPARGRAVTEWLRAPVGVLSGVWAISDTRHQSARRALTSRRRIRKATGDAG